MLILQVVYEATSLLVCSLTHNTHSLVYKIPGQIMRVCLDDINQKIVGRSVVSKISNGASKMAQLPRKSKLKASD